MRISEQQAQKRRGSRGQPHNTWPSAPGLLSPTLCVSLSYLILSYGNTALSTPRTQHTAHSRPRRPQEHTSMVMKSVGTYTVASSPLLLSSSPLFSFFLFQPTMPKKCRQLTERSNPNRPAHKTRLILFTTTIFTAHPVCAQANHRCDHHQTSCFRTLPCGTSVKITKSYYNYQPSLVTALMSTQSHGQ